MLKSIKLIHNFSFLMVLLTYNICLAEEPLYLFCPDIFNRHIVINKDRSWVEESFVGFNMSQGKIELSSVKHTIIARSPTTLRWLNKLNPNNPKSFQINLISLETTENNDHDSIKLCFKFENIEEYENSLLKEMEFEKRKLRIY